MGDRSMQSDITKLSDLTDRYIVQVRQLVLFPVAEDFSHAIAEWVTDMRETGKSEVSLASPSTGEDGGKAALLDMLKPMVREQQLQAARICYDAQEVFSKLLVPDLPTVTVSELLREAGRVIAPIGMSVGSNSVSWRLRTSRHCLSLSEGREWRNSWRLTSRHSRSRP